VLRGRWVLDALLGAPPPPPPPNIPAFPDSDRTRPASVRERTERHRRNPVCAGCHARMDPIGFSLENFDAVGAWRTVEEGGAPIDARGTLPDGTAIDGAAGLRAYLLTQREAFVRSMAAKLLTYATGRVLEPSDQPSVGAIMQEAAAGEYRWSSVILAVVHSDPFLKRTK
jgi:hypothetical protein